MVQAQLVLRVDKRVGLVLGLGFGDGLGLHRLAQPSDQLRQLFLHGTDRRGRRRLEALTVIGQQGGIQSIGFGPFSLRFGGMANVGGIED
jgi:hypothetical protein